MGPTRILHVLNQNSGSAMKSDIETIVSRMISADEKDMADHKVFVMTGEDDERKILEHIRVLDPEIVTAGGGDGTINFVASLIMNTPVKMGIIPLGSANGLASELGVPAKVEDALKLILSGKARPVDVIRINEDDICLHLSDFGINARIVGEFEKEGKRGFMGYVKQFFREMTRPGKTFRCTIKSGGRTFIHKAHMILIANASFYRSGANMNPTGSIDDGRFEVIVLKPYKRWVLRTLLGAFTGTLHNRPNIETYECESVSINVSPPEELQIDGEHFGKKDSLFAEINKHALNIILPD